MAPKPPTRARRGAPSTSAEIVRLRREMDGLNAALLRLIESRARLAVRIGRAKAKLALPAADAARELEMLDNLGLRARGVLPRAELVRIFRAVFAASRRAVIRDRQRALHK